MPRYIDADALKKDLEENYVFIGFADLLNDIIEVIDTQPTADVVEVVRCEDCKYRDDDDFCTGRGYPNVLVPDDGFCDKGERREDVRKSDSDDF